MARPNDVQQNRSIAGICRILVDLPEPAVNAAVHERALLQHAARADDNKRSDKTEKMRNAHPPTTALLPPG